MILFVQNEKYVCVCVCIYACMYVYVYMECVPNFNSRYLRGVGLGENFQFLGYFSDILLFYKKYVLFL